MSEDKQGDGRMLIWRRIALLCGCAWLLLSLGGCGSTDEKADADVETTTAELNGTVQLTLSTPHPVPVLQPVVTTKNSMFVGAGATVVTGPLVALGSNNGKLHTEPDAVMNDVWSRGTAELGARTLVRGILHAATYTGSIPPSQVDSAPAFEPLNTLSWPVKYPTNTHGPNKTVNANETKPLSPGQYGDVVVNSQGTLNLASGTYYLKGLTLESASRVNLDQANGPVIIYVETGLMALRGTIATLSGDAPDLLIAYLGTTAFSVETLFNGALIAPSAMVTLRAVTGTHTGFFYAKDFQILDAHARVQYRAPLAIVTAANPTGSTCASIVASLVPAANLQAALARYCGACASPADTDRDKVQDCLDGCPYDAAKTAPGPCGCGVEEVDWDGDKVPNCNDRCPWDPKNVAAGQCGCLNERNLQPAGTPCNDTACPQSNATCDGAGVCGNPSACLPAAGCTVVSWRQSSYWLCLPTGSVGGGTATPKTQTAAQQACSAKGLPLARIDSLEENRFLQGFIKGPTWIGANSIQTNGVWRWSTATGNNGDQFWSGGVNGSRVGSRFHNWTTGAPLAARCGAMMEDGRWGDVPCTQALPYICEYNVPVTRGEPMVPPGMPHQPPAPTTVCISEAEAGLPVPASDSPADIAAAQDQLQAEFDATNAGTPTGIGANPPTSGTCPDDPLANGLTFGGPPGGTCAFSPVPNSTCMQDSDCAAFGTGLICRHQKNSASCTPDNSGVVCSGTAVCGTISCPAPETPCDQKEVCNPSSPTVTAALDNPDAFVPQELESASLFGGTLPSATPTPEYSDPAHGPDGTLTGKNNAWCSNTPRPVANADKALPPTNGSSGTGSKIQFDFKPDLIFEADAGVLAMGESDPRLHAAASLSADVKLNDFLGQSFTGNIFKASLGMRVQRCSIDDTTDTKVTVFGIPLLSPEALGLPVINSDDPGLDPQLYEFSHACNEAVGKFQLYADRAKKAFRDGQQLVRQFKQAKQLGQLLTSNLCAAVHVVGAVDDRFPGGDECPENESAAITIKRFLDYYQAPGSGQIDRLRDAQMALAEATNKLKNIIDPIHLGFDGIAREESSTILNVQFFIGPVPMVLQVDIFAKYGVGGGFDLKFTVPTGLVFGDGQPQPVAKVTASVVPYAAAGLSAFVGAGFDFGPIAATVGIEGALTLASLSAPIYAGVGLDVQALKDIRPIPQDVLDAVVGPDAFHFGIPTAFKFYVNYEYGAGVDLNNILSGEINGKLRIKFFFFSRTWRKNIVRFNGWSAHYDLIKGGGDLAVFTSGQTVPARLPTADNSPDTVGTTTTVAAGASPAGLSEAQIPLMVLEAPSLEEFPTTGVADFDSSSVEQLSYDALCCSKAGETCEPGYAGRPQCCAGLTCDAPPATGGVTPTGTCVKECTPIGRECTQDSDCCQDAPGTFNNVCGSARLCQACITLQQPCSGNADCCSGTSCSEVTHVCEADIK